MREELKQHLLDIIGDSKDSAIPLEIAVDKYTDSLLEWFNKQVK